MHLVSVTRPYAAIALGFSLCTMLSACPSPEPGLAYLSPMNGQTGWDPQQSLVAYAADMNLPEDYPLPELIRVTNLTDGGLVEGTVLRLDDSIRFTPDSPFEPNTRYAWMVDVPATVPHGPSLVFPESLQEPSVFSTESAVDVLGGGLVTNEDGESTVCALLSRAWNAEEANEWTLRSDGQTHEAVATIRTMDSWGSDLEMPEGHQGVDIACFDNPFEGTPEAANWGYPTQIIRFSRGSSEWFVELERTIEEAAAIQRRSL